jgi:mono/diheme cytochrome c family protein
MSRHTIVFSALLLFAFSTSAQQTQPASEKASASATAAKIPPEALKVANPVKPTPASIAVGKKKYGYDCAMCHGADGDGKGDLAVEMKLKMNDYRDAATLKTVTDGEMFYVIKNGNGDMPSEADRLSDEDVWNLVNYMRTLAKSSPSSTSAASNPPKPKTDTPQ